MASQQNSTIPVISDYIKNTLIPSISSIRVANIFDHELTDLAGFPSATITLSKIDGEFLDNARNLRTYTFKIRIFIDRNRQNFGTSTAETILRAAMNELILAVDADHTLGGNCIIARAFDIELGYVDRESNNIRLAEVTLEVQDAVTYR